MASRTEPSVDVVPAVGLTATTIATCLVLACAMQLAENLLPKIPLFPWLKLGLSHLILLPFLLRFGAMPATALALSRSLLTWMVAGTPLTSLAVGMLAGVISIAVVGGALRPWALRGWLGWVGLGVASATAHNLVQLGVVEVLLVDHAGFYFQMAPLLIWSLVSGTITALLAAAALPFWQRLFRGELEKEWPRMQGNTESEPAVHHGTPAHSQWGFYLGLALMALVIASPWWLAQLFIWLGLVLHSFWPRRDPGEAISLRKRFHSIWRPMKATWPLLVMMAWLHLFHGEGHLLGWGGLTREGLAAFGEHAIRLLNLALLGPKLLPNFPRHWLQKSTSPFAQGILLALPALAGLPVAVPGAVRQFWKAWRNPGGGGFSAGLLQFSAVIMAASPRTRT